MNYDPMDLFMCEECGKTEDRDLSFRVHTKLVCEKCMCKLLNIESGVKK